MVECVTAVCDRRLMMECLMEECVTAVCNGGVCNSSV